MRTRTKERKGLKLPDTFEGLVRLVAPMAIRDDVQHTDFVEIIDRLMKVERLSRGQADYLETLVELVEAYESRRHAINTSAISGTEMLRHVVDESGISSSDLARQEYRVGANLSALFSQ